MLSRYTMAHLTTREAVVLLERSADRRVTTLIFFSKQYFFYTYSFQPPLPPPSASQMARAQPTAQLTAASLLLLFLPLLLAPAKVTSSTLAVARGSAVCGVAAHNDTVYCIAASASSSAYNSSASPIASYLVFSQVSGGAGFLCGVDGAVPGGGGVPALFCWPHAAPSMRPRASSASAWRTTAGT